MAGGTWNTTDVPVLPGLYLNFEASALASIQPGARGVAAVPVKAHWGAVREFVEIAGEQDIADKFSLDETDGATAYTTLRLALLGGPSKILAYRLADDNAVPAGLTLQDTAAAPAGVMKLETKYPSDRAFKVTVQVNPVDGSKRDIKLYEDTALLATFTFAGGLVSNAVDAVNHSTANQWLIATKLAEGNGALADISSQSMTGGNPGISGVVASDYTEFISALETQEFNVLALDGISDPAVQTSVQAWVARVREAGKGVICALGGPAADDTAGDAVGKSAARSSGFNHEAIVNVGTGAILDGISYSSAQIAAYVAGLIAGQKLAESTTYAATPFDDVTRRWSRSEMESAVNSGVFILVNDGRSVKALRGVNTLTSLRQGQNNAWKKIRTIRVMDSINADLLRAAEDNYIGKVNNTAEGRMALIGACKQYMRTLARGGVIEDAGWDVYLDPVYYGPNPAITPAPDQVYLQYQARLTDTMEIILGTFKVM